MVIHTCSIINYQDGTRIWQKFNYKWLEFTDLLLKLVTYKMKKAEYDINYFVKLSVRITALFLINN